MSSTIDYQVVLVDGLGDVEKATLNAIKHQYAIEHFTTSGLCLNIVIQAPKERVFANVATWLSHIGADRDIFCIRRIETHYTDYTSPEVKELLRI